jgi:hypothetical protein
MPTTAAEFEEDTAYERYVLSRATPLVPMLESPVRIEVGEGGSFSTATSPQTAQGVVTVGARALQEPTLDPNDLRPLLFGAAWKVLDLLVELTLETGQVGYDNVKRGTYKIETKAEHAAQVSDPPVQPFADHLDLWRRILKTYAATKELRHALVHRRLMVDHTSGSIQATNPATGETDVLTADEQSAFCRLADGVGAAIIDGALSGRQVGQLNWLVNDLAAHHGQLKLSEGPVFGRQATVVCRPLLGSADVLELDGTQLKAAARTAVSNVSHYDLEVRFEDGRMLAGPLEDAPDGPFSVSVATTQGSEDPRWLRWT